MPYIFYFFSPVIILQKISRSNSKNRIWDSSSIVWIFLKRKIIFGINYEDFCKVSHGEDEKHDGKPVISVQWSTQLWRSHSIGNTVDKGFALWRKRCDKFTIRKSKHCKYTITSEFYIYIKRQRQLDLRMSNQFLISRSHLSINVSITNEK